MTTTAAPALHVQGLERSFKALPVLRGGDFDVPPGTSFALLGSNRAGKTGVERLLSTRIRAGGGAAPVTDCY